MLKLSKASYGRHILAASRIMNITLLTIVPDMTRISASASDEQ